jgi:transposase InsO family protein
VAPNLLDRQFDVDQPNQVWASDIPYVATEAGWLYPVVALDLLSRQIVGWALADHMRAEFVMDALRMAYFLRRPEKDLIFHSDRGSQYCSHEFQRALKAYGMISSMSRKGNCWDNAPTESLWRSLNLNSSVERVRVCVFPASWQGATTTQPQWLLGGATRPGSRKNVQSNS